MDRYDVIVVGGGPTGLACAIEAKKAGLSHLVIEKGCVVNSLFHYPINLLFFTTSERMEIGEMPLVSHREKPTRNEALKYYRLVTQRYELAIHQYEEVLDVGGENGDFRVETRNRNGVPGGYAAKKLILATGYYDIPIRMGVPGEDLPKVSHYFQEAHPYYDCDVAVIGGRNSAAVAALDLFRHGARVTLIHRQAHLSDRIKYWLRPDIENRIKAGEIQGLFETRVIEIRPDCIRVAPVHTDGDSGAAREIKNDFVFALTGYQPDVEFMRRAGVQVEPRRLRPCCNPETLESNVPGLYLAGVIVSGLDTNEIFIENGRFHAKQIIPHLAASL
jgi:thioredoxin reductase (NADPH)